MGRSYKESNQGGDESAARDAFAEALANLGHSGSASSGIDEYALGRSFLAKISSSMKKTASEWMDGNVDDIRQAVDALIAEDNDASSWQAAQSLLNSIEVPISVDVVLVGLNGPTQNERQEGEGQNKFISHGDAKYQVPPPFAHGRPSRYLKWRRVDATPLHRAMRVNRTKMAQSLHAFHSIALPVAPILPNRLPGSAARQDSQDAPNTNGEPGAGAGAVPLSGTGGGSGDDEKSDRFVGLTHAAHDELGQVRYRLNFRVRHAPDELAASVRDVVAASVVDAGGVMVRGEDVTQLLRKHSDTAGLTHAVYVLHGGVMGVEMASVEDATRFKMTAAPHSHGGGDQIHVAMSKASGPQVADIRPGRLEPSGQLYYLAGGERERQLQQQLMQAVEGGASAADASEDKARLDASLDAIDSKLVVTGVRSLPYWYVADAGNGLTPSGKRRQKASKSGKWFVEHEGGCPVASWADHVGLSLSEDDDQESEASAKNRIANGLKGLASIKAKIARKMQGLARRTLGFGGGGVYSGKSPGKGSYVGFRQQRLMWIDVGAGPASLGVQSAVGSAGTWAESSLPRLDLGAWGLVGESTNEELKPHDEVHSVGPGLMVPRGVDPMAAAGAMSAFQGQLAAHVARSAMQLLIPPALPHWRERMLSETTRTMLRRGLVPIKGAQVAPAEGAAGKDADPQLKFLREALLPFRSAARPLIIRVLVMVDDDQSSASGSGAGRGGRGGDGVGSMHAQLAAMSPGEKLATNGQGAGRARSARHQLQRLRDMKRRGQGAAGDGGGGGGLQWRDADVATLLDDWEGMRSSGSMGRQEVADLVAARIGARLRAGLGPLAVDTDSLVMAPGNGATPAQSAREDMMKEVEKQVKRSKKGLGVGYGDSIRASYREMLAPPVALASVQTASVLVSDCERCPFLLEHALRRGLAMTTAAHHAKAQGRPSGADAVLFDVDDFARGAAAAGIMDEIMLADLPRGSEDSTDGAAGPTTFYQGGALSPAVLPIIIVADDHSLQQGSDGSSLREDQKAALQAQSAVPLVIKSSWSEHVRTNKLPANAQARRPSKYDPQPVHTSPAMGTFHGSAIIGVLNADDAVYQQALGQGLGRTQLMTAFHCHGNPIPLDLGEQGLGRALVGEALRFAWGVVPTQVSRRLGAYHTTADEAFGVSFAWSASHTPFGPFAPARAALPDAGSNGQGESSVERVKRSEMSLSFHVIDAAVRNTLLAMLRPALASFEAAVTEARAFHLLDSNSQLASAVAVALGGEDFGEHATGEKNKDKESSTHSHVVVPRVARHALSPAAKEARTYCRERWLAFRKYLTTVRLALAAHSYQQAYGAILGIAKDAALLHGAASTFRRYLAVVDGDGAQQQQLSGEYMLVGGKFVAKMAAQAAVRSGLALSAPLMQLKSGALLRLCGVEKGLAGNGRPVEEQEEDLWQAWASDRVVGVDGKTDDESEGSGDASGLGMRRRFVRRSSQSIDAYTRQLRLHEGSGMCPSPTGLNWLMATQVRRMKGSDATLQGIMIAPKEREELRDADRSGSGSVDVRAEDATTQPVLERLGAGAFVLRRVVLPWMIIIAAVFVGGFIGMGPCGFAVFAVWHDYCRRSKAIQRVARTARGAVLGGGSKLA